MNTLLANSAIIIAIVALLTEIGHAVAALTNFVNARTRMLEMSHQIAALQSKQIDLAAAQGTATTLPPVAAAPLIVQLPPPATVLAPAPAPTPAAPAAPEPAPAPVGPSVSPSPVPSRE